MEEDKKKHLIKGGWHGKKKNRMEEKGVERRREMRTEGGMRRTMRRSGRRRWLEGR